MTIAIRSDDLSGPEIAALIARHKTEMLQHSPPESSHALLLDGLRDPSITVWTLWADTGLAACGALKVLGDGTGEIKSMHTAAASRGEGHGRRMLVHILAEARIRGLSALLLETGAAEAFRPARQLYEGHGFAYCGPFADYTDDPNSVFMVLALA